MYYRIVFVLIAFSCSCMHVQGQENSLYSIRYVQGDEKSAPQDRHQYILDIGKETSHFYDWDEFVDEQINDSICQKNGIIPKSKGVYEFACFGVSGFHVSPTHLHVLKNLPDVGSVTVTDMILGLGDDSYFYYEEPMPEYNWEMLDSDTIIGGYDCQKARMFYRGHTWTAWYAPEIAISDGPWKLCGLPGLILEARDAEGEYHFKFSAMENNTKRDVAFSTNGYRKITPDKLYKLYRSADNYLAALVAKNAQLRAGGTGYDKKKIPHLEYFEK